MIGIEENNQRPGLFKRIKDHLARRNERRLQRVQDQTIECLRKYQEKVDEMITKSNDLKEKDHIKKLSESISKMIIEIRDTDIKLATTESSISTTKEEK